jgi:hypothetical protein
MRLADLPRTVVVDGKRRRRHRVGQPPSESEAYRALLRDAQDVYRQALGCIVMMVNVDGSPLYALRSMREAGRGFLRAADAQRWEMPAGVMPANQPGSTE